MTFASPAAIVISLILSDTREALRHEWIRVAPRFTARPSRGPSSPFDARERTDRLHSTWPRVGYLSSRFSSLASRAPARATRSTATFAAVLSYVLVSENGPAPAAMGG
jgi:hypothetical protein